MSFRTRRTYSNTQTTSFNSDNSSSISEQVADAAASSQSDGLMQDHNQRQPQFIPVDNIHVEAPSDLPGGYQMEVEIETHHWPILITIPKGGVREGQYFVPASAQLLRNHDGGNNERGGFDHGRMVGDNPHNIPVGHWRDGFWHLCSHGICHVTVWQSLCCPLLAMAQVITRLQLSWYGTPASNVAQVAIAFQTLVMMLVAFVCMRIFIFLIVAYMDPNADPATTVYTDPEPAYFFFAALDDILFYIYIAFCIILIRNVRAHVRAKYNIPESENSCRPGCEDVCCSLFCPCFAVSQMMRHTSDYNEYRGTCCSRTGLEGSAPGIV